MYLIIAFGYARFFTLSAIPKMSPASLTKYYKSLSSHLFVNWASRTFYWENSSSRSNNYNEGLFNYFNTGGNTPGANPNNGVSNWGTIKVNGSCFTYIFSNNATTSGTYSKSYLKSSHSNIVVKSFGISSPSWKQLFKLSAISEISGT